MAESVSLKKGQSVSLKKGNVVNLTKEAPKLDNIMIGLGWDEAKPKTITRQVKGFFGTKTVTEKVSTGDIDCDAFAIVVDKNGHKLTEVYFGNKNAEGIKHHGDNLTGAGEGDDEVISIKLSRVHANAARICIAVNIYSARSKGQRFGMVDNAFMRLVNEDTNEEMCIFNNIGAEPGYSNATTVFFGEFIKSGTSWEFKALGTPSTAGSVAEATSEYINKL